MSATELQAHANVFAVRLASYPDWPEIDDIPACEVREVPAQDRPTDDPARDDTA